MSVTTVGPAKAALLTLWRAVVTGTDVQVTYGNRVTLAAAERVTIGNAVGETMPQSLGPKHQMRENYDIKCKVSITRNGTVDDQQAVTERCLDLYALLEQTLRALPNENLGLAVVDVGAWVQGPWELTEAEATDTGGPINTAIEFNVHVQARFRLP